MATLLSLRDGGDPLPSATVLLSPWTDLEGTGESMKTRADVEAWLDPEKSHTAGQTIHRDLDPRHPLVSPIYADLHDLPPMLVHVGNDECLLDDSVRLVERAKYAGVETESKSGMKCGTFSTRFPSPKPSRPSKRSARLSGPRLP